MESEFQNKNDKVRKVVKVKMKKYFILGITLVLFVAVAFLPGKAFAQTYPVFDNESPTIMVPTDIYVTSQVPSQVFFSVKALDNVDGTVPVFCDKISMGTTFKMGKTTVRCEAYDKAGNRNQASFVVTLGYEVVQIPPWVKNITSLWVNNTIDDDTYAQTISYLVHNKIVKVPTSRISDFYETEIPVWVKTNAQHWVNGKISDDEYSIMLQWLINRGIVKV